MFPYRTFAQAKIPEPPDNPNSAAGLNRAGYIIESECSWRIYNHRIVNLSNYLNCLFIGMSNINEA